MNTESQAKNTQYGKKLRKEKTMPRGKRKRKGRA
jgi:hypothetical protein